MAKVLHGTAGDDSLIMAGRNGTLSGGADNDYIKN